MQKLIYPCKTMGISQNYNGKFSHYDESHAKDYICYPIDEACGSTSRDWFYAPCDVIIKRIFGVNNKGTNTIWMQSVEKVKLANGKETIVTIRVTHPEDDDLNKIKVGQKFTQFTKMFREGKDGYATGNHFHMCVSTCSFDKLYNQGWIKNSNGSWVTAPNAIKPEEAFFVDKDFTTIKNAGGLKFKTTEVEPEPTPVPPTPTPTYKFSIGEKVIINGNLYGSSNADKAIGKVNNKTTKITRIAKGAKHPYNTTGDLGWMDESSIKKYEDDTLKVGDKVRIIGAGSAGMNGGKTAYGIGWERKILKIWNGKKYPYQVGDNTGTTGYYKENALKKI